ncbi:22492_t:CDS:2, partial [Dentiscutata erythropus]
FFFVVRLFLGLTSIFSVHVHSDGSCLATGSLAQVELVLEKKKRLLNTVKNTPSLRKQRTQELQKLITSYPSRPVLV